jgi:hypothetical protein
VRVAAGVTPSFGRRVRYPRCRRIGIIGVGGRCQHWGWLTGAVDNIPVSAAQRLGLNSDFDRFAAWQQSEDIAQFAGQMADLSFDRFATFVEM